jgi:hypothetical protein
MGLESFLQPGATPFPNPINMFRAYIARQPRITWPVLSIHSKYVQRGSAALPVRPGEFGKIAAEM